MIRGEKYWKKRRDQRKVEEITRIILRPLAFFTFGAGSILQSASQFGVIPQEKSHNLASVTWDTKLPARLV